MQSYLLNIPDNLAMEALLQDHDLDTVGAVVRLAWLAGLQRSELIALTWEQVLFLEEKITINHRQIPLDPELRTYLLRLSQVADPTAVHVVVGKRGKPLTPQVVSHLMRQALDDQGQTQVRLVDLRHDYILRQLKTQDWQAVSRWSGVAPLTLQLHFAPYLPSKTIPTKAEKSKAAPIDQVRMQQIFQTQGTDVVATILRLAWQGGLNRNEIVSLTWGEVADKSTTFEPDLVAYLSQFPDQNSTDLVVRGPLSGKAMAPDRISRLCRTALVQGGLDNVTLQDLRLDYALRTGGEAEVVGYIRVHGVIDRKALGQLLGISDTQAYGRLKRWAEKGTLVQVGSRYYLPSQVAPPHQQRQQVVTYLKENQIAYRKDVVDLLCITPTQCSRLLKSMVEDGTLTQSKQRYMLA